MRSCLDWSEKIEGISEREAMVFLAQRTMLLDGPSASTFGALTMEAGNSMPLARGQQAVFARYLSFEQGLHVFDAVLQSSTLNGTLSRGNGDGDYEAGAKHVHYAFVLF